MPKVISTEVDGKRAELREGREPDEQGPLVEFPAFEVSPEALAALQAKFDDGLFTTSNNLAKGKSMCGAEARVDDIVVKCPHRAVIKSIYLDECGTCHRKKKTTTEELCLGHAALHWGLNQSVKVQMEMELA